MRPQGRQDGRPARPPAAAGRGRPAGAPIAPTARSRGTSRRRTLWRAPRLHPRGQPALKSKSGSERQTFIAGPSLPLSSEPLPPRRRRASQNRAQPGSKFTEILETGKQLPPLPQGSPPGSASRRKRGWSWDWAGVSCRSLSPREGDSGGAADSSRWQSHGEAWTQDRPCWNQRRTQSPHRHWVVFTVVIPTPFREWDKDGEVCQDGGDNGAHPYWYCPLSHPGRCPPRHSLTSGARRLVPPARSHPDRDPGLAHRLGAAGVGWEPRQLLETSGSSPAKSEGPKRRTSQIQCR